MITNVAKQGECVKSTLNACVVGRSGVGWPACWLSQEPPGSQESVRAHVFPARARAGENSRVLNAGFIDNDLRCHVYVLVDTKAAAEPLLLSLIGHRSCREAGSRRRFGKRRSDVFRGLFLFPAVELVFGDWWAHPLAYADGAREQISGWMTIVLHCPTFPVEMRE